MTVHNHPERARAEARGDLAEQLVPLAAELAFVVRDEDRAGISAWLDQHHLPAGATVTETTRAFLVALAALVPVDATQEDLLAWLTFDEFGQQLGTTDPVLPASTSIGSEPASDREEDRRGLFIKPASRRAEFADLRAEGLSVPAAAQRVGVKVRQGWRYEDWLIRQGLATWRDREEVPRAS